MRKRHKLSQYDGGRFFVKQRSYTDDDLNLEDILSKLPALILSRDPEDRCDAGNLIFLLERCVWCPDGVWVVSTRYKKDKSGRRFSDERIIWSAHLTKAEAERWHKAFAARWKVERHDYQILPVAQADRVPLYLLRHPAAKVNAGRL